MIRGLFTLGALKAIVLALFMSMVAVGASASDRTTDDGTTSDDGTVSPVPEPSTWVMMIAGFWLVGWRLKRSDGTVVRTTVPVTA